VEIIRHNITKNLMRHGIAVSAPCRAEFRPVTQWTAPGGSASSRNLRRTPAVLRDCRLEPRKNTATKGRLIAEIMLNPDGPLWVGRLRDGVPETRGIFLGIIA
jgi:hypothetical protein